MNRRDALLRRLLVVGTALVSALVLAAGCGRDETATGTGEAVIGTDGSSPTDTGGTGDTGSPPDSAPAATDGGSSSTINGGGTDGDGGDGDGGGNGTDGDGLPGDYYDIGPAEGEPMTVVGVRYDDVLNFRTAPDPSAPLVATAEPLAADPDIRSAGEGRLLERSAWWKVTVDGEEAWANVAFLGALGDGREVLAVLNEQGVSEADDLDAMVDAIVAARGSEEVETTVTLVSQPTASAVTFDMIGLADDAVAGERFSIVVTPAGSKVTMSSAEVAPICSRGVSDGLCV